MTNYNHQTPPLNRRLTRSHTNRWIGGVLGGVSETYTIDANVLRLLFIIALAFSFGTAALIYLIAWVIIPDV